LLPENLKVQILAPADALLKMGSFDHLALFMLGTIGVRLLFPVANPGLLVFSFFTFATTSETLQYFTSHREQLVLDWVFDLIGIRMGLSLIAAIRHIRTP
jgi:VanZ family protein